jgi:hypothetical protein
MSYQPPPGPVPTFLVPPPPVPPTPPVPAKPPRRRGLIGVGVVLLLAGLVAGGVMFVLSTKAVGDTVKKFARAPVGCTTTLQFEKKAVFTIYVETKGVALDVGGDCSGNGSSYDRSGDPPPTVSLSLVDSKEAPVALTDSSAFSYDTDDYRGAAVQQVSITQPGTYRLTVQSAATDFAIAIGGDPDADARRMKYIGATAVAAGLLLGVLLMLLGLRRRTLPPSIDAGLEWPPSTGAPSTGPAPAAPFTPAAPAAPAPPPSPAPFQVPTTPPGTPVPGSPLPPPPPPGAPGGWGSTR